MHYTGNCEKNEIFIRIEYCKTLESLGILSSGYYRDTKENDEYGRSYDVPYETGEDFDDYRFYIKEEINSYKHGYSRLNEYVVLDNLQKALESFIKIFNLYLTVVVDELNPKFDLKIIDKNWTSPNHIYSFNYTNSFLRFYKLVDIDFLHGQLGENQNIVLGISEIESETIKKMKAYGFTKYHQKILKNTQYNFLYDLNKEINKLTNNIKEIKKSILEDDWKKEVMKQSDRRFLQVEQGKLEKLKGKIFIWGHSLDFSDKNYINEIFEINNENKFFEVIVYYHNNQANFELLANLIHILGKEKVELWMKNKWLTFEPNPQIDFGV